VQAEPDNVNLQYNLGLALAQLNRIAEATPHLAECVRLAPDHFDARSCYAAALVMQGNREGACEQYAAALALRPDSLDTCVRLVDLLVKLGRIAEAAKHLEAALRIAPGRVDLSTKLAWLMATSTDPQVRNPAEAVRLAEQANQATGERELTVLNTLATAYSENGQFDEAIQTVDKAIAIAAERQNQGQVDQLNRQRAEYEQRRKGP
jgi:tetratricopeptide (TPR) repeat protein